MKINYKILSVLVMASLLVSCGGGSTSSDDSGEHVEPPASTSNIDTVLRTGDVINTAVTEEELIQATLDEIEASKTTLLSAKVKIFNLNPNGTAKNDGSSLTNISWNPTHDASLFWDTKKASVGFEIVPNALFKSENTAYCSSVNLMDQPLISVDGTTVWVD